MSAQPPEGVNPVQRAINIGVASGVIVGLLRLSPWYSGVIAPLLSVLGLDMTELTTDAVSAIASAHDETIRAGYHYQFDNDNPARPPVLVDRNGKRVAF